MWWCSSIFNIMMAVTSSSGSVVKSHPRATMAVEVVLAIVIPMSCTAAILSTKSYKNDYLLMTTCLPNTDAIFYSFTVPTQVICVCGLAMATQIVRSIKQVWFRSGFARLSVPRSLRFFVPFVSSVWTVILTF